MALKVVFRPQAETDLLALYRYIAKASGPGIAGDYIDRIELACLSLATFPNRGTKRDDLAAGLRTIGFERRVIIAYRVFKPAWKSSPLPMAGATSKTTRAMTRIGNIPASPHRATRFERSPSPIEHCKPVKPTCAGCLPEIKKAAGAPYSSRYTFSRFSWRSWASTERVAMGRASRRFSEIGSPVSSQ